MQKRQTSAVTNRVKGGGFSETERKERIDTSSLMEQILSSDSLNRAYLQVVRNKGAECVDGMKYTELKEHLERNGEIIKEQLRTRKYKPQPVRRVEISTPDGGVRNLGVPTVTDRFVQQAILTALDMMNDGNGLGLITAKLDITTRSSIVLSIIAMNVNRLTVVWGTPILVSTF